MIKFEFVPHSEATNSYDLLLDVIKAIDEEPLRFYWSDWVRDATEIIAYGNPRPVCDTVACLHGWITLLTASEVNDAFSLNAGNWFPDVVQNELEHLAYAEGRYGYIDDVDDDDDDNDRINRQKNETQRQYADRGIAAIRLFMDRFADDLKKHEIVIPKRVA